MYPILVNRAAGSTPVTFPQFERGLLDICHAHREENRALAFAFILYTFTSPEVMKMLHDHDYWRALHEISGDRLTVFSFDYAVPPPRRPVRSRNLAQWMTKVDAIPSDPTREFIQGTFGVDVIKTGPSVLFFQVMDDQILDSVLVSLTEEKVEDLFIAVRELIKAVAASIGNVLPENRGNSREIWDLVTNEIANRKFLRAAKWIGEKINLDTLLGLLPGR